jgi:5-methylcytosine-specific restriction endonuclease McrA
MANPGVDPESWGGRKAQQYVQLVAATYGRTCWLCGLPVLANERFTADHVIPRSKGGAVYDLLNLAPAHKHCNESRGNRPAESYDHVEDSTSWFDTAREDA